MTDDLVKRIRNATKTIYEEAADEIIALRADVRFWEERYSDHTSEMNKEIERLRAALDKIATQGVQDIPLVVKTRLMIVYAEDALRDTTNG